MSISVYGCLAFLIKSRDAWPGQLDNVPVNASMSDTRDIEYLGYLEAVGKTYMAPVSSWFSTHFGAEVSYSKNWVFKSETLWKDRWDEILQLGSRLNFIESELVLHAIRNLLTMTSCNLERLRRVSLYWSLQHCPH